MPEREPFRDDIPGYLKYWFFRGSCGLVGALPVRVSHGIGVAVAEVAYRLSKRKREVVYENMRRVHPQDPPRVWPARARRSFHNYARYWVDFLRCYHLTGEGIIESLVVPHGTEWFDRSLEKGRGVVLALPHYGSWDMIGGWVGHRYPSFWAAAEVLKPLPMYEFHTELRRRMGIRIIPLRRTRWRRSSRCCWRTAWSACSPTASSPAAGWRWSSSARRCSCPSAPPCWG